jgi:branched-chain amino acid transport system substrate-binding protein
MTRREFLKIAGVSAATLSTSSMWPNIVLGAAGEEIKAGFITDLSGEWTIYGIPMHHATRLAIQEINDQGGVLGRRLRLITEDSRTDTKVGPERARKLIELDKVDVLLGTISSAMREAVTPVAIKSNHMLYVYPTFYEGGVCTKLIFCSGEVPAQQIKPFLPWVMDNFGKKVYIIGADYIWPHILNRHVKAVVEQQGGKILGEEYVPIPVSDFSSSITRIQRTAPDVIFSDLAGSAHLAFYKQFVAAGLQDKIKVATPVIDEYAVAGLGPVAEGIYSCFAYFDELKRPRNEAFKAAYKKISGGQPAIGTIAESMYVGTHLWALAVQKAGTTQVDAVTKALESGLSFDAPEGRVTMEGATHHLTRAMHIGVVKNGKFDIVKSLDAVPSGESCKLM